MTVGYFKLLTLSLLACQRDETISEDATFGRYIRNSDASGCGSIRFEHCTSKNQAGGLKYVQPTIRTGYA